MSKAWFLIAAITLPVSSFAVDQEDMCKAEAYRSCIVAAQQDFKLYADTLSKACTDKSLDVGSQNVNCTDESNFERTYGKNCEAVAERAVCRSSSVSESTSAAAPFMPAQKEDQSYRPPAKEQGGVNAQQSPAANSTSPSSTPKPSAAATPTPQDPGTAQSEATADIAQCNQIQSEAQRCCGNPLSCASPAQVQRANQIKQQISNGPAPGQSIPNYCAQLGQLSNDSGNYNADMASVCYAPQSSCSRTCQSLAQKYYSRASNCSDATCSIFQSAAEQLSSIASSCDALSSQVSQWSSQGISTGKAEAGSSLCSNQNYNAQSAQQNQKSNPLHSQSALSANNPCLSNPSSQACAACTANPGSAQCQAAVSKSDASGGSSGTGGYASVVQETGESGFNPENMHDMSNLNASMDLGTDAGGATTGGAAHVVANNSGGGIPGAGAGGGGAKMDPKKGGAPAGANSSIADIMQGNRSGGGYSQDAAKKNSNDNQFGTVGYRASSTGGKRGPASVAGAAGSGGYLGMDLKKYLPGGEMQPYRGIAGLNASMEINGKSADLFKKISTKIEEKCRLGILWECR